MGLQFFPDRPGALHEMRRVVRPGGRIILNVPGPTPPLLAVLEQALRRQISPRPGFHRNRLLPPRHGRGLRASRGRRLQRRAGALGAQNAQRAARGELPLAVRDERGLESLTMRALGEQLGVEAMSSLYYHVANKDELLDGTVDLVYGQIELPPREADWKTAIRRVATSAHGPSHTTAGPSPSWNPPETGKAAGRICTQVRRSRRTSSVQQMRRRTILAAGCDSPNA